MREEPRSDDLHLDPASIDWLGVATHEVAFLTGPDGVVRWVSPSIVRVLGWDPEEVIGSPFTDLVHPDDVRATQAARDAVYGGVDPSAGEPWVVQLLTAEGDFRWMAAELKVLQGDAGAVTGVASVFRDVDELVEARRRADEAELRLSSMFDALLNPHLLLRAVRDREGRIVDFAYEAANVRACEYLGVAREDLLGSRLLERFPGQAASGMFARLMMVVETGVPLVVDRESIVSEIDPDRRYFDIRGVRAGDGVALTWRDVTETVEAVDALAASEAHLRRMVDNISDVVVMADVDARIRWVSDSVEDVLGWHPDDMLGHRVFEYLHPDDMPSLASQHEQVLEGRPVRMVGRVATADGGWRWLESSSRAVRDPRGRVSELVATWRDVDATVRERDALAQSQQQYRFLLENAPDVVFRTGLDSTLTWVSPRVVSLAGREVDELLGHLAQEFVVPDDRAELDRSITGVLGGDTVSYRGRLVRPDGTTRWISVKAQPTRDADGEIDGAVGTIRDIESLAEALATAERERNRAVATVETFLDPHVVLEAARDADGEIVDFVFAEANQAACDYNQIPREQLIGTTVMEILPAHAASGLLELYRNVVETGEPLALDDFEYPHEIAGEPRFFDIRASRMDDGISFTWRDVTDRHERTVELAARASHDVLTGLPNRGAILEELDRGITAAHRSTRSVAALLVDLDHFKKVNDSLGHLVGDRLLVVAATLLAETVRGGDLVGRLGGDEFVVVMRDLTDPAEAVAAAGRIVAAFRQPLRSGDLDFSTSASVGIAVSGPEATPDELLRDADTALYRAKSQGRDRASLFNDDLRQRAVERLNLEAELRPALGHGELELWYQPEVSLTTGRVTGVEALLRWHHPSATLYTADRFIDIAEETGMILEIGEWVIGQACRQAAAWARRRPESPVTVRVNLSVLQLAEPGLLGTIDDALGASGVDPSLLCVEITEAAFLQEARTVAANLQAIRDRGIHIALDDFGTGHASLAYLRDFPIHVINIDRSLTEGLLDDEYERHLVAGVVSLAGLLGITVTAEGIESPRQAELLRGLGCTAGQGFLYSAALPVAEVETCFDHTYEV